MKYKLSLDGDIECDKACAICGVIEIEPENRWRRYKAGKIICCELYDRNVDACNADKGEAMRGWECPKCGMVYAPWVHQCGKCGRWMQSNAVQCGRIRVVGGGDAL